MKVFLTGATGVLGRRVIPLLVDAGHEVVAVARTPDKAAAVLAAGGRPVAADLFDASSLADAVRGAAPDAIVNLATHIPSMTRAARPGAWDENDRIRREASGHLVDAAIAARARVFVQESITFPYADGGDAWIDEEHPMDAGDILGSCLVAEANAHRFTAEAGQGARGIVLRFAMFYGPDAAHTEEMIKAVSLGLAPVIGPAAAYQSMVHLDDAAAAVVAALGAPAGVYNVVDDTPLTRAEAASAFARGAGRRRARRAPAVALKAGGSRAAYLGRSQRVSHAKLTDATGWQPEHPSLADGLPSVVGALPGSAWDTRLIVLSV